MILVVFLVVPSIGTTVFTHSKNQSENQSLNSSIITLSNYKFNPLTELPNIPKSLQLEKVPLLSKEYYLVQFVGPIKEQWKEMVKDNEGLICDYIPDFTFIIKMDVLTKERIEKFNFIKWIGPYQPAYKISPPLLYSNGMLNLTIRTFQEEGLEAILSSIIQTGTVFVYSDGSRYIKIRIDSKKIVEIANITGISWIELDSPSNCFNANATWVIQSGIYDSLPIWDKDIHGEGQIITVCDTGISGSGISGISPFEHEMFKHPFQEFEYGTNYTNPNHRKVYQYYVPQDAGGDLRDDLGHGTHVSGTLAGDNTFVGGTNSNGKGIAYGAKIIMQDIGQGPFPSVFPPKDYHNMFFPAYSAGSRIHSNSWGSGNPNWYDTRSEMIDNFTWNNKDFLVLFAAGNYPIYSLNHDKICAQGNAKNILTVGATQNDINFGNMTFFSCRGPAGDGRIKPTVVAPGEYVMSANKSTYSGYVMSRGTSMSTPVVAGAAALTRQYFMEGWYPSGEKNTADAFTPSAALIRAMIINGAVEINGSYAYDHPYYASAEDYSDYEMFYPNNDQGWGLINLGNCLYYSGESRTLAIVDEHAGVRTGERVKYTYEVTGPTEPIEVALVWTDYPSSPSSGKNIVNDLDLIVIDPQGRVYFGNNFAGKNRAQSRIGGVSDRVNVEESVLRLSPVVSGSWTIKVRGWNIPQGGSQPFALVVTGGGTLRKENRMESQIDIVKPKNKWLYLNNEEAFPIISNVIIRPITISTNIKKCIYDIKEVRFYVDGILQYTDNLAPFEYYWNERVIGRHRIKATLCDIAGNIASDEQEVWICNF